MLGTYKCDVVMVLALRDWVTWHAFVKRDSRKSSSARAHTRVKDAPIALVKETLLHMYYNFFLCFILYLLPEGHLVPTLGVGGLSERSSHVFAYRATLDGTFCCTLEHLEGNSSYFLAFKRSL